HLQIQVHGVYPQALPKSERAKVDDFYAARDNTMPSLPWPSIAPPFTARSKSNPRNQMCQRLEKENGDTPGRRRGSIYIFGYVIKVDPQQATMLQCSYAEEAWR
ncbi:hypothetical protein, partial [Donghicola sp. XS_ASV15]|uniref:hypothetical protein n=1 Tax=Donghicola sp. XS_ASV15 TaxID=3241295 RepID=UPI003512747C